LFAILAKSIAIAIAILGGKCIAIPIAILFSKSVLQYYCNNRNTAILTTLAKTTKNIAR